MKNKRIAALLSLAAALMLNACSPTSIAAPVYTIPPPEIEEVVVPPALTVVPKYYEVSPGDTLIAIAITYDLDHNEVARWNNLRNPDLIQPGQRLRLTPPLEDPVTATVAKQPQPQLKSLSDEAAPAAEDAALQPGQQQPAAVQRQSTIVGSKAAAVPAPGTAPYKTTPQAIKYAYSPRLLKKLQNEWQQQQAGAAAPAPAAVAEAPAPATAAAPALPAVVDSGGGDTATRESRGIIWGLPSSGEVISRYSSRSKGTDYAGSRGDPVYAAADGVVIYVGTGVKAYGRLVILRHEDDYLSAYAHNESILVKEDQQVKRGSKISTMGDSGSERIMLHFEVRKNGKPFDPAQVLP